MKYYCSDDDLLLFYIKLLKSVMAPPQTSTTTHPFVFISLYISRIFPSYESAKHAPHAGSTSARWWLAKFLHASIAWSSVTVVE